MNAPGGKLQPRETAEQCAIQEVYEETGLEIQKPRKIGTLVFFKHDKHQDPDWIAHVFLTNEFQGTLKESKEGILRWYPIDQPPFDDIGKMTHTGTDMRSKGEAFGEISILEEILRS